jgi:hypothetical protein
MSDFDLNLIIIACFEGLCQYREEYKYVDIKYGCANEFTSMPSANLFIPFNLTSRLQRLTL